MVCTKEVVYLCTERWRHKPSWVHGSNENTRFILIAEPHHSVFSAAGRAPRPAKDKAEVPRATTVLLCCATG